MKEQKNRMVNERDFRQDPNYTAPDRILWNGKSWRVARVRSWELFGYVLAGNLAIHIGQQTYRAKKGESFYFRPTARHYIEAAGKTGASFIWVSTPPSF